MFTFFSMDRVTGTFDDLGGSVTFNERSTSEEASICGVFPGGDLMVYIIESYDLDVYIRGGLKQRYYRFDPESGKRYELFTEWPDHRQFGNIFILDDERIFLAEGSAGDGQLLWITDQDGRSRTPLWDKPAGYAYGMALSPDKTTLAFHITGAGNEFNHPGCHYSMNTVSLTDGTRRLVYEKPGHLMFGTDWTADGKLIFQDCFADKDPAHRFSDIVVASKDGSEVRYLTEGQSSYFGTSFGRPDFRSGGSNYPLPLPDGRIVFTERSPGSHPDSGYDPSLGNHHEDVYAPENAAGGARLVIYDPKTGIKSDLTGYEKFRWDFRPSLSPDGRRVAYTSAKNGQASEIRMVPLDGGEDIHVTYGHGESGADHARPSLLDASVIGRFRSSFIK